MRSKKERIGYWILFIAILLGPSFILHEAGHFAAASTIGVEVEEVGWGLGLEIASKEIGNVTAKIKAFPVGAYVKPSDGGVQTLEKTPIPQKVWFYSAGILANFVLAMLAYGLLVMHIIRTRNKTPGGNISRYTKVLIAAIQGNGLLFVFNAFLPLPMLDGGQIIGTLLAAYTSVTQEQWIMWGLVIGGIVWLSGILSIPYKFFKLPAERAGFVKEF